MIWFDTKPVLVLAAGFLLYESPGAGWLSGAGSGGACAGCRTSLAAHVNTEAKWIFVPCGVGEELDF